MALRPHMVDDLNYAREKDRQRVAQEIWIEVIEPLALDSVQDSLHVWLLSEHELKFPHASTVLHCQTHFFPTLGLCGVLAVGSGCTT